MPQVEQTYGDKAVEAHVLRRIDVYKRQGMGYYVHTIDAADGEIELHPSEFEKWEAVEFLYPGYLEDLLDACLLYTSTPGVSLFSISAFKKKKSLFLMIGPPKVTPYE